MASLLGGAVSQATSAVDPTQLQEKASSLTESKQDSPATDEAPAKKKKIVKKKTPIASGDASEQPKKKKPIKKKTPAPSADDAPEAQPITDDPEQEAQPELQAAANDTPDPPKKKKKKIIKKKVPASTDDAPERPSTEAPEQAEETEAAPEKPKKKKKIQAQPATESDPSTETQQPDAQDVPVPKKKKKAVTSDGANDAGLADGTGEKKKKKKVADGTVKKKKKEATEAQTTSESPAEAKDGEVTAAQEKPADSEQNEGYLAWASKKVGWTKTETKEKEPAAEKQKPKPKSTKKKETVDDKKQEKQVVSPENLSAEHQQSYLNWAQKKVGWAEMSEEEKKESYYGMYTLVGQAWIYYMDANLWIHTEWAKEHIGNGAGYVAGYAGGCK